MFFFIRRRRIGQIFSSFSAFFIVHFHTLALAKISERDTFSASPPPGPSLAPSPADSLGAPVAFPIFRPPMVSVHRQMGTAEKKRPMAKDHRLFPSPSLHNLSSVEEVSATSAGGLSSSLASSVVEEEDDNLSQEEEELAFSPVQIFNPTKLDNGSSSNSTPPVAFHRLGEFGTRQNGKKGTDRTTTTSNLLPTHPSAALSTSKNNTQRFLPFENVAHSSITPQFPVFTGMGMEIIESGESEGERTTSSTAEESEKEKQWKALQHKMQYNLTTEAKGNSQKTLKIGESAKNRSTEETILKKGIATSANARNIYTPSIHIEPITKPTIGDILLGNNATIGAIENSTKSIGTMATEEDEVTEDLLAIFTSTSEHSPKTTEGKKGDTFGQQIGDQSTQMTTKVPMMGPIEEIIPRPNISKTRGNEQKQQQQSQSSHTERPTTTHQNISSSRRTTTAQSEPTTEATNTTPTQITENATPKTTQMTTTTTELAPTSTSIKAITVQLEEREMHTEGTEGRITIGTKRKPSKTTLMGTTDNSEWLGGNHIEEGSEEAMSRTSQRGRMSTKAPPPTAATPSWSSTRWKSGGETNDAKENKKAHETSRTAATERTEGNVNFRLLAIAGIIAVLFIMVGIGSICTGRYVRKSRQLHGKYRPAAYELQTTRPPPLTSSSMTFAPSNRMANSNELQQNRHFEFGQIHQIPPPVHCPHQLTMNGNDCREERLI